MGLYVVTDGSSAGGSQLAHLKTMFGEANVDIEPDGRASVKADNLTAARASLEAYLKKYPESGFGEFGPKLLEALLSKHEFQWESRSKTLRWLKAPDRPEPPSSTTSPELAACLEYRTPGWHIQRDPTQEAIEDCFKIFLFGLALMTPGPEDEFALGTGGLFARRAVVPALERGVAAPAVAASRALSSPPAVPRSLSERIVDFKAHPEDWELTAVGASRSRSYPGGINLENSYVNKRTGEILHTHDLYDKNLKSVPKHPSFRNYGKSE